MVSRTTPDVAWVEIMHSHMTCTCGHTTKSTEAPRTDEPWRKCEGCGLWWFLPGAADCESEKAAGGRPR